MPTDSHTIRITEDQADYVARQFDRVPKDGSWLVEFRRYQNSRTLAQNRLSWLWYTEIASYLNDNSDETVSPQDVHDWLCGLYLEPRIVKIGDQYRSFITGTSGLKVKEFSHFLQKVEYWTGERGIPLTFPAEIYERAMGK